MVLNRNERFGVVQHGAGSDWVPRTAWRRLVVEANRMNHKLKKTMKKLVILLATAVLAVSVIAGEFPDVSVAQVKALAESRKAVIIDVNGSDSYKKGHVPGALDFAAIQGDLASVLPKDKNTP